MEQKTFSNPSSIENKVLFNERFLLTHFEAVVAGYNTYEGVDIKTKSKIFAFVRQIKNNESIKFRKDINSKFKSNSAKFLWSGEERMGPAAYHIEVFHRLGPSVSKVINTLGPPPLSTCFLLIYNVLKLIQKLSEMNLVYRGLNWSRVYLSAIPGTSNDLCFYEYLDLRKKGDTAPIGDTLTSSIGSHLGLAASFKDDFESVCFMAMQLVFKCCVIEMPLNVKNRVNYLLTKKTQLNLEENKNIPSEFIEMYLYARNLPNTEVPNYEYWKKILRRQLTPEILKKPFFFGSSTIEDGDKGNQQQEHNAETESEEDLGEEHNDEDSLQSKISKMEPLKSKVLKDLHS